MSLREKIRDAQVLAAFANLTEQGTAYFRRNYPDFAPRTWWDYSPTDNKGRPDGKLWITNQSWLREAWKNKFEIDQFRLMRLLTSVFDPDDLFEVNLGVHPWPCFAHIGSFPGTMDPYWRAVLFLNEQKWRARLCERCKLPFVAGHSKQKYCGEQWGEDRETCFDLVRKEQKQRDHLKHRNARNRKRRNEYAKSRNV
jgi:hypothetical protein